MLVPANPRSPGTVALVLTRVLQPSPAAATERRRTMTKIKWRKKRWKDMTTQKMAI
jgi:hypothetical protein